MLKYYWCSLQAVAQSRWLHPLKCFFSLPQDNLNLKLYFNYVWVDALFKKKNLDSLLHFIKLADVMQAMLWDKNSPKFQLDFIK